MYVYVYVCVYIYICPIYTTYIYIDSIRIRTQVRMCMHKYARTYVCIRNMQDSSELGSATKGVSSLHPIIVSLYNSCQACAGASAAGDA